MKFSSALKFNAVADWWDEYIAYDMLKRHIYQLEKEQHRLGSSYTDLEANERTALVEQPDASTVDSTFITLLNQELKKIVSFYEEKEKELLEELAELEELVAEQDVVGLAAEENYMNDDGDEDDDDDDDDEQLGDHVHFEDGQVPKRRRRKSSSAGYGPRSGSGTRRDASQRRWSISSSEELVVENQASESRSRRHTASTSKSPIRRARDLANKLIGMRDSVTSLGNETVWTAKTNYAWDIRLLFKRRITNLYVSFSSLKSYVEVNYSGFRKILKKYDKLTYNELKDRYMHEIIENALPFRQSSKDELNAAISQLVSLYAKCVTGDDLSAALQQLKIHQREYIAWERNTVWRQMLAQERRGAVDSTDTGGVILMREEENGIVDIPTPLGGFKLTRKKIALIIAVMVLIALMNMQVVEGTEANKCFAILVFSTI
ncbi:hypothetical protein PAXINDRAFT_104137, partial [Paxillus involutus ATCC 200175]